MARARLLKPGFFANETLTELHPFGRLLFIGLWTLADREGRLPDRPKWIKGALFPYESVAVATLLGELEGLGFIYRYDAEGERYLQIINFTRHQAPHRNEVKSVIPPPPGMEDNSAKGGATSSIGRSTSSIGASAPAVPIAVPIAIAKAVPVVSDPVSAVCASFAKYGKVTGATVQAIEEDVTDFTLEWVEKAEREARNAGFDDRPPWGYVHSILERWKSQGGFDEPREPRHQGAPRSRNGGAAYADPGEAFAALLGT